MRTAARVLLVVAITLGLLVGAFWLFQRHLIYFPAAGGAPPVGVDGAPPPREVKLATSDGLALDATYLAPREPDGVVVLVANGNGGDRMMRTPLANALAREGLGVLLFDYRGYGGNPGSPSEKGLGYDVRAARNFLVQDLDVAPERLLYFGESIGTGVITGLAAEHPPAGMVLRSPFSDLASIGSRHYRFLPVRLLLRDRYPQERQLRTVEAPVTVVYGSADSLIPPEESRAAAAAVPNLRTLVEVEGAGHNDAALLDGPQLIDAVMDMADLIRSTSR